MTFKPTLMALCLAMAANATAAPLNPVIVNGQVTFTQDGNSLTVTNSPNAIINWSSFSIAQGELVRFVQQSGNCLLYTSPSPRDRTRSRMPSSA